MAKTPTPPRPLRVAALREAVRHLPGWRVRRAGRKTSIEREYEFPGGGKGFLAAVRYMAAAAPRIDRMDHHPEWTNAWKRLTVRLTTHDAGDRVTARDVALATYLEGLFRKRVGKPGRA
jgi:4a-hydroxytetrahydrobiopterin dehydratase